MNEGWLWLSILKMTASPSPMSTTPAFSPGPWMTRGPLVGSVRSHFFDDLYEQCSFHIAEKMPSSVSVGSRPIRSSARWYSSGFSPWAATSSGVMRLGAFICATPRRSIPRNPPSGDGRRGDDSSCCKINTEGPFNLRVGRPHDAFFRFAS